MDRTKFPTTDKHLICKVCEASFLFTASEQRFYSSRALAEPRRCPECRAATRERKRNEEKSHQPNRY